MPKKGKVYLLSREEREEVQAFVEERIHLTLQVTSNVTSILCSKKGWHTEDGTRLSTHKLVDNKE